MHYKQFSTKLLLIGAMIAAAPTPVMAQDTAIDPAPIDALVHERFLAIYSGLCDELLTGPDLTATEPYIYQLFFRRSYQSSDQPDIEYRLYEYPCYAGAYNISSVYFSANDYDEVEQIFFPFPDYDVTYKDEEETIVDQVTLNGFYAWENLTNPGFDEKSMTLYSNSKWRGLGDASSSGRWQFKEGRWLLKSFDIDPTYDGKISMIRIFGEGKPPTYE
ncbi:hypothetical protein MNBD_ALPHA11-1747 [hydrothermal vent metagenome]|uniref:DUF1176 domain-containing protein n=1 Tax=hydrothermal vent metagenome TaxID=652676 RepID=A0A3B0U915_9ZZZZ